MTPLLCLYTQWPHLGVLVSGHMLLHVAALRCPSRWALGVCSGSCTWLAACATWFPCHSCAFVSYGFLLYKKFLPASSSQMCFIKAIPMICRHSSCRPALSGPSCQPAARLTIRCSSLAHSGPRPPHVPNAIAAKDHDALHKRHRSGRVWLLPSCSDISSTSRAISGWLPPEHVLLRASRVRLSGLRLNADSLPSGGVADQPAVAPGLGCWVLGPPDLPLDLLMSAWYVWHPALLHGDG